MQYANKEKCIAFMTSTKRSCNTILQNIVITYTRPHCSNIGGICYNYVHAY